MSRKSLLVTCAEIPVPELNRQRRILIRNRQQARPVDACQLRGVVRVLLLELLRIEAFELCLHLVSSAEMIPLNETFLRHRGVTDVIAFDYADPVSPKALCGEIFICLEEAVRQARRFRVAWQRELVRYVVHAVLHLRGYDDQRARERRDMKREEDRLLRQLARRFYLGEAGGLGLRLATARPSHQSSVGGASPARRLVRRSVGLNAP